jgi:hypothetical protein
MLYLVRNSSFVPQMEQALLICTFPAAWTSFPNTGAGEFINIQFFPEAAGQNVLRPFQFVERPPLIGRPRELGILMIGLRGGNP